MNKTGCIIIIENDLDDQEILSRVFQKFDYKNEIIFFSDVEIALNHLIKTYEDIIKTIVEYWQKYISSNYIK